MIAVFLSFVANPNPTVKLIGFGMAVAVLIDSTIVRMVLVPAVDGAPGQAGLVVPDVARLAPQARRRRPGS